MSVRNRLRDLDACIVQCQACPRLRQHCLDTAAAPRAAFRDQTYWGLPVPTFHPPRPGKNRLLVVGLAPAAHGANRTGRMFTGDRSGDFLYRAMHETGFASQPQAHAADDGLTLRRAAITAALHCAPPANKPANDEINNCRPFLEETFDILQPAVVLCLGQLAHQQVLRLHQRRGCVEKLADHPFAHAAEHHLNNAPVLIDSYHPSQQNTFTGRLTHDMLRAVFHRAAELLPRD